MKSEWQRFNHGNWPTLFSPVFANNSVVEPPGGIYLGYSHVAF